MEKIIALSEVTQTPNKAYGVFPSYVELLGKQATGYIEIHIRCTIRTPKGECQITLGKGYKQLQMDLWGTEMRNSNNEGAKGVREGT